MARPTRPEVAFVSAVTALACNGPQQRPPQESAPVASVVVPAAPQSSEAAVVEAPQPGGNARADALRENETWDQFKVLWRQLDDIEPKGGSGMPGIGAYAGSIDSVRGQALSEDADRMLRKLEEDQLLSKAEARVLRQITNLRIQNLVRGFTHLMMMHRMPPPYTTDTAASVERLERKIDELIALRKEGKIGTSELRLSLEAIQREAITLYVLGSLGHRFERVAGLPTTEGDAMLKLLEQRVTEARQDGNLDEELVQLVEEARTLVPAIRELVATLEQ